MAKKILMAATNYWTSPYQVGSHHYAREFARNGWEVFFVSDPISPFHNLLQDKSQLTDRKKINKGLVNSGYDNIQIYVPFSLITPNEKPVFRTRFITNIWHKLTIPNIVKYSKQLGFGYVDLLWFDSLTQFFWINEIKYKRSILRIADRFDAFRKISPNFKKLEEELKDKTDIIIYTAKTLKSYLRGYEDKMFYMPNGVNIEHFLNSKKDIPDDLKEIPKPRAVYVGAIEEWFGINFLAEVARKCKNFSFVLIGSPNINVSNLKNIPNIYFLGRRDYSRIPAYISNSDVGIIVFDVDHPVVSSVNPIKLYEYMTCGIPVVATRWEELEMMESPAYLAEGVDDFVDYLNLALEDRNKEKYISYAKLNSWNKRFNSIIKIIDIK